MSEQDLREKSSVMESEGSKTESPHARRRFLKAGLIGVPVILTLKSRPAWGQAGDSNDSANLNTSHLASHAP